MRNDNYTEEKNRSFIGTQKCSDKELFKILELIQTLSTSIPLSLPPLKYNAYSKARFVTSAQTITLIWSSSSN